jgi:hypothetical protein
MALQHYPRKLSDPQILGAQVMIIARLLEHSSAQKCLAQEVEKIQSQRASYTPEYMRRCRELSTPLKKKVKPMQWSVDPGFQWWMTKGRTNEARVTEKATASKTAARAC